MTRKKQIIITGVLVGLLGVSGLSQTGRATFSKLFALLKGHTSSALVAPAGDVEQRAKAKHGWDKKPVNNSVVRGIIAYYDENGMAIKQANLTLYRKYPDRLRIEFERNGSTEIAGFDHTQTWQVGRTSLSEDDARDIRAMLRMSPERLFTTRGGGARYREAGQRIEDDDPLKNAGASSPAVPKGAARTSLIFDQVEMEDTLGPAPTASKSGDKRWVYYYVNREDSLVSTARWLEPDDPRQRIDDTNLSATDMRVDFSSWSESDGVLWPMEIICKKGGKKSFRIQLSEVKINQQINDTIFQRP